MSIEKNLINDDELDMVGGGFEAGLNGKDREKTTVTKYCVVCRKYLEFKPLSGGRLKCTKCGNEIDG